MGIKSRYVSPDYLVLTDEWMSHSPKKEAHMRKFIIAAAIMLFAALPATVLAHHTEPGACGQFTAASEDGFTLVLNHAEVTRNFGPFSADNRISGDGTWPSTYGPFSIEPGNWTGAFYKPDGSLDIETSVFVEACQPEVTPRPTPTAHGSPPPATHRPHITPPPTSTENPVSGTIDGYGLALVFGLIGILGSYVGYKVYKETDADGH